MKTVNIIENGDWQFLPENTGSWVVSGGSAVVDTAQVILEDYHSIAVTPDSSSPITLSLSGLTVSTAYANETIQFHCRIKCDFAVDVSIQLTHDQELPSGYDDTRETQTAATRWIISRSNTLPIPEIGSVVTASVSITVSGHQGEVVYMTLPYLMGTFDVGDSKFALSVYTQLPQFILQSEIDQAEDGALPDYPIMRMLEAGLSYAEQGFDKYYDFEYLDADESGQVDYTATPSQLVDPAGVSRVTAEWLSQFLGFELDDPRLGATPWAGLPATWSPLMTDIDATGLDATPLTLARSSDEVTATFAENHGLTVGDIVSVTGVTPSSFNGTFEIAYVDSVTQVRWAQIGSDVANSSVTVKGNVSLIDTSWDELEDYNPDFFDFSGYVQWQLDNSYHGYRAGTKQALVGAAQLNLTGDEIVTVVNGYDDNPWNILVKTKTSETPDGSDDTENQTVLVALNRVKPAGFKVYHLCTATGT